MFQNADRLLNQKSYEEAYDIFQTMIEKQPTFGKTYNHMGWLYRWRMRDYVAAEANYKKAMELSPEYISTYANYASLLNMLRRWDDLPKLVEKALTIPGVDRGALYNELGIMFETQGKFKEAMEEYKRYAYESLDSEGVEAAKQSIERCKKKIEMFK